ncbi:MAG: hypothetical protein ABEJ23_04005 [Haloarculaceae archaeon]
MTMGPWTTIASALAAVNVLLLAALTVVWVRNYRTFRTTLVAGLIVFGAVMLVENALAIYFFLSMGMLYSSDPHVQQAVAVLRALQLVAIAFLTYVTMK